MKKKITQWFIGLLGCIAGFCVSSLGVSIVTAFIGMMNNTGKEFVGNFVAFIFSLVAFIFAPYLLFHVFKDGVRDEYK